MTSSNTTKTHEWLIAEHLKKQRDAYTGVGFTLGEANRLIEAEVAASNIPNPAVQAEPKPAPLDWSKAIPGPQTPGVDPFQPPYRFTCEHTAVIDALVQAAGGIQQNGAGQSMIANRIIHNP